ncbi:MAG: mannose-6-phosphate isomerase [Ruminococcaceae bacterium]|nr:mannose-6-phosphate isomerase [Oscillospiraceae bacterium]
MKQLQTKLLQVGETRVWRTYKGGKRIDEWRGRTPGTDSNFPEDWIASTVMASNPGRGKIPEGLSRVLNLPGQPKLKTLFEEDPEGWFGAAHAEKFGSVLGILIKMIDAGERLTIQVHPDKDYAKQVFHSDYGKTEAWYILGGEDACIYFGFKPGITRQRWKALFDQQDISGMLECLHRIPVKPGDSYLICGGVPHAIGQGCFLVEVQEPTDYTMRTELVTPGGLHIHLNQCHQGVGFEKMLDCFHYEGLSLEETRKRWKVEPQVTSLPCCTITSLIDARYTKLFSMRSLLVEGKCILQRPQRLSAFAVLSGSGSASNGEETLFLKQGDYLVVPAGVQNLQLAGESFHLVECLPPALD